MAHTFRINIFNNYIYKLMFIKIFTVIGQTQVGIPFGNQGKTSSWNDFLIENNNNRNMRVLSLCPLPCWNTRGYHDAQPLMDDKWVRLGTHTWRQKRMIFHQQTISPSIGDEYLHDPQVGYIFLLISQSKYLSGPSFHCTEVFVYFVNGKLQCPIGLSKIGHVTSYHTYRRHKN